jgi:hypothetical protein
MAERFRPRNRHLGKAPLPQRLVLKHVLKHMLKHMLRRTQAR